MKKLLTTVALLASLTAAHANPLADWQVEENNHQFALTHTHKWDTDEDLEAIKQKAYRDAACQGQVCAQEPDELPPTPAELERAHQQRLACGWVRLMDQDGRVSYSRPDNCEHARKVR